ncbi:MAG: lysophosphatidate acyltransferase [Myxococcota bacterium]|jgi:lysophosphatidate acyltransferase
MSHTAPTLLRRLTSVLRFCAGFLFIIAFSIPYIFVVALLLPWRMLRIKCGNLYGKVVGPAVTRMSGTRAVINNAEALEGQKPAIYVTNHTSELDPFIAMWLCPLGGCGIAKKEIVRVPFFGQAYWLSGHLLIDRSDREKAIASMAEVGEIVRRNGLSIWIWPEGTRSPDGRLLPFKKGFAHLAIATGLPIVPVIAHSAHRRWPSRSTVMYPGQLDIDVLPAIDTAGWSTETLEEHVHQLRQVFIEALHPEQRPQNLSA